MKLHLPIMMALFAVANYAQADDRLIFELGDTDKTLAEGAVWTASSATLKVEDVAANNIGINYDLFSISFNATAEAVIGKDPFTSYGLFFQITDLGEGGSYIGEKVNDGFGYTPVFAANNKYKVDFKDISDDATSFSGGTEVDKSLIEGAHKFTLVFEGTSISGYVLENETYTELFQTTWELNGRSMFEKITSDLDGYEMVFGVDNINNTTVSNIAFYNGDITKPIPEPTTATLGLMALAGLVARRRRASR